MKTTVLLFLSLLFLSCAAQTNQIIIKENIKKFTISNVDSGLTAIEKMDTAKAMKLIDIAPGLEDSTKEELKKAVTAAPEIAKGIKEVIKIAQSRDQYSSALDWIIDLLWKLSLAWGLLEAAVRKLTFLPRWLSPFYWFKKLLGKHKGFKLETDKKGNVRTITGTWQGDIFIPEGHEVKVVPPYIQ